MEENLTKRIGDQYLTSSYVDGQVITHSDMNQLEAITKTAINENYYDIQRILNGSEGYVPSKASSLDGATLSRYVSEILQSNDNKIPSSLQVKNYVDSSIETLSNSLADVATSGSYNDLVDAPENLVEDANYVHTDNNYTNADKQKVANAITSSALSGYATQQWVENKNYLTQHQNIKTLNGNDLVGSGNVVIDATNIKITTTNTSVQTNIQRIDGELDRKAEITDLPTKTSDLTNDSGFVTSSDLPTKTSDLTNDSGFVTSSDLDDKQDVLVSGTNIKTINNQSILGSGNIEIQGGGSSEITVLEGTEENPVRLIDFTEEGLYLTKGYTNIPLEFDTNDGSVTEYTSIKTILWRITDYISLDEDNTEFEITGSAILDSRQDGYDFSDYFNINYNTEGQFIFQFHFSYDKTSGTYDDFYSEAVDFSVLSKYIPITIYTDDVDALDETSTEDEIMEAFAGNSGSVDYDGYKVFSLINKTSAINLYSASGSSVRKVELGGV